MPRKRAQYRPDEVTFYEFSTSRWFASETRMMSNATTRGIFFEMLNVCYAQGSISKDELVLTRICACTVEQFREAWALIGKHFYSDPHDPTRYKNPHADAYRSSVFRYISLQRTNGGKRVPGGKKSGAIKPAESDGCTGYPSDSGGYPSESGSQNKTKQIETNQNKTKQEEQVPKVAGVVRQMPSFDYEQKFGELWGTYPAKGRTKIEDSKRYYIDAIRHDPEAEHARIMASISPGGNWHESDMWERGFICALVEFLRNRRWKENPEPAGASPPIAASGGGGRGGAQAQFLAALGLDKA